MKSAPSLETQKMQEFDLPKDWSKQELKKIAEVLYGKSNPAKTGEIPLVGSSGVYAWTNDPLINYPTLIIGRKGSAGQVHLFTTPCFPSDTTFYLKIDFKKVDLHYLYYYMICNKLSGEHAKTTMPSIARPDLENMTVLLPLLHEQKNIAYVLSTIRDAQEKNVALINSLREIKKSTLKHLFKYGVVSVDDAINVKLKETEIGLMPNTWVVVNLGDVAKYVNGYPFKPTDWKKVGLPIIRIQNLTGTQNNPNFFDGAINERYRIKNGDILISWSASLGVFNWKKEDAWLNQHIFKVEDYSPKITKEYFYYVVGTKIEGMKDKTHGSTMHHITKLEFLNVKIPLPPLQDQNNIVEILSGIDSQIEAEESKSKALQHLFDSMAKELTTAKIRVNKLVF